jgi:hypothetical protein
MVKDVLRLDPCPKIVFSVRTLDKPSAQGALPLVRSLLHRRVHLDRRTHAGSYYLLGQLFPLSYSPYNLGYFLVAIGKPSLLKPHSPLDLDDPSDVDKRINEQCNRK